MKMLKGIIFYIFLFIFCVLAQVLIFNQIILFHIAIPLIFVYFILRLPIDLKLAWVFTLSFFLGLTIDIFSDTPGVNALACTIVAACRRPIFYAYVPKDDFTSHIVPSSSSLGIADFAKYLFTFIIIYCFLVFSIEYFNFAAVKDIMILSISSSLLSFIILLAADCLIPVNQ